MVLMVGPFLLFSDLLPGLISINPVQSADIQLSFVVNTTVYTNTITHENYNMSNLPSDQELH